jgi:2-keto-4-pentenoate hydratase/2-oxohepta-3-ene-1,7-dioic acid hydratase in catechol pathway
VSETDALDTIFNCRQMISFASKMMTIKPGDIFYTGRTASSLASRRGSRCG